MEDIEKYKILIADDEPLNLKILFDMLAAENYRIYSAPNGDIAFEQAVKYEPSAIIMDWDMPGTNGLEAVARIRKHPQTKSIPITIITGKMISTENLKSAFKAGANDYIRKPFNPVEIITRIKSMIRTDHEYSKSIESQKKIAEKEIMHLNDELERSISKLTAAKLRLIEKGQSTSQLIHDLQELRAYVSKTGNEMITKIISYSKINDLKVNWGEFEILFGKIHQSFFHQLQGLSPELTPNERKLCAFIKLNMTTKEISAITNRRVDTVKKAKHRLRCKFQLENMDSLYQTVQKIN